LKRDKLAYDFVALSFDDVLLMPGMSEVLPTQVDVSTRLTNKIRLATPIVSAAMDTVTEAPLAIAMAREGGMGVIHRNLSIEDQVREVERVKKFESWIVREPITLSPKDTVAKAKELIQSHDFSGFPVVEKGKLVGILTRRDLRFEEDGSILVSERMTRKVITAGEKTDLEQAKRILNENKIEKLPVVNDKGILVGLITDKDIHKKKDFPNASRDSEGRLLVGAAIGALDFDRARALHAAGCDVIVIDTAHGHSKGVIETARKLKTEYGDGLQLIAGNIATGDAAEDLIDAGVDAVKVGVGPGSICTTRIVSGVGVPQLTAISMCAEAAKARDIPVIADGGIRFSGDISKAIAAGADCVMIGNLLAGTEEAPGETTFVAGRKYKKYRGMGSVSAMASREGSKARYGQQGVPQSKLVPEGVEGVVPFRGSVREVLNQLVGGLRSAMGYCGARTIPELKAKARFMRVSGSTGRESHPHDVVITDEAPNYPAGSAP
jgi:IMP dehydrogenase